ncbi:PIR Superfamily Protein [Plasmodium ovale wallikeri]|uniref:PIR Superfamily Protein n=1 Tax=Plasmodium ovale wallikeri TaxID=864142 RepID=A0A1A9AA33_PLAOA|nr:PIR Superfamily Protein [Plasmodium ovale wallikeri]SBT59298.1 PIR Superfamily Protein [Plasmodium ovale wallikeri]
MTETIYSFVNYYSFYKNIIDGFTKDSLQDISYICNKDSNNFKNVKSTCYGVLMFLNHLEEMYKHNYIAKGCRFLNYWLYNDDVLKDTNNFNAVSFYETLKSDDNHSYFFHRDLCGGNIEHINKEVFVKIEKLIKLHEKFNEIIPSKKLSDHECSVPLECSILYGTYMKEFCIDINNVFCVELENFKPKYDAYMKNAQCNEHVPKVLASVERVNIAAAIFTSFGPWLLSRIRKNNRIFNNLSDENNHMTLLDSESHEPYINKREYNIAYRSTINS